MLGLALLAGSTTPAALDVDLSPTSVERTRVYAAGDHGFEPDSVPGEEQYSVALPEGLYRVSLRIGSARQSGRTTVKAEARRLMANNVATRRGESVERSFLVDVRRPDLPPPPPTAPGADKIRLDTRDLGEKSWDEKLSLEFSGTPLVTHLRIEPVRAARLFLVGDSTVTDQYAEPFASWGQMLPALLDDRIAVSNQAKSGASLKSFLVSLRLDKVLSMIAPDDWLFIQFGHNDQKKEWPATYVDPVTTYPAYLKTYIAEARRRGAHPVLVTPPERRNFEPDGHIRGTLGDYAEAMRLVAKQERVPLIDLHRDSIAIYEALGPALAPTAFAREGADHTHHDNYGAWLMANAVARGMRMSVPALASHVVAPAFDPAHPPSRQAVGIVPSRAVAAAPPAGS
ncbi:MAG: rhamnogalacturonan acetylesterase [Luteolibacter sp.]